MTASQIKGQIDAMTEEDRFLTAAFLQMRANERDEDYRAELSRRMDRMDVGKKTPLEFATNMVQTLEEQGL
jgi:hypothetical protein